MTPEKDEPGDSNYAGRWVARMHGRVVAQGGTPEQAMRASQQSRHKEIPEVSFIPLTFENHPLIGRVREILSLDPHVHLVGGAVRDMLLGRIPPDLDFALPEKGISAARKVADALQADFVLLDRERDIGRVIVAAQDGTRTHLDFAAYRGRTLVDDLAARDFTVNALAYNLQDRSVLDPLDGARDLRAGVIRACSPSTFQDDPLRILRAVRQAAAFGFRLDKDARAAIGRTVDRLSLVSVERIRDELFRILDGPKPDASVRALEMLGALPHLMPELVPLKGLEQSAPHIQDAWEHSLSAMSALEQLLSTLRVGFSDGESNDLFTGLLTLRLGRFRDRFASHLSRPLSSGRSRRSLLFFALLYHDAGKPAAKSVEPGGRIRFLGHEPLSAQAAVQRARHFNQSNDEIGWLDTVIRNHMRLHAFASRLEGDQKQPSRRAIYRFFRDTGDAGVDLTLLSLADMRGTRGMTLTQEAWAACLDIARLMLENWWEKPQESVSPPRLVDGDDLMRTLNLPQGPQVGAILESIREEQAAGGIATREQALELARGLIEKGFGARK